MSFSFVRRHRFLFEQIIVFVVNTVPCDFLPLCFYKWKLRAKSENAYGLRTPNLIARTNTCWNATLWGQGQQINVWP